MLISEYDYEILKIKEETQKIVNFFPFSKHIQDDIYNKVIDFKIPRYYGSMLYIKRKKMIEIDKNYNFINQ